jgi:hypothetical protein
MDGDYLTVIIVTTLGFGALAAILLVPIYRFLKREDEVSKEWTRESLEERARMASEGKPADQALKVDSPTVEERD